MMMYQSQFIEMFDSMSTTPVGQYVQDSYPGEWGVDDAYGTGIKVIRTTNFTNTGKLDLTNVVTRNIEEKKVNRKRIQKYDTILERSGGTADNPVGRVVLFEEDGEYLCNNFTQVLRFKNVDSRFAFYALYYFYQTNKTAIRAMGSKTTGIQNLNMAKYLEIGIPSASEEQQKGFVSIATQADKSKFDVNFPATGHSKVASDADSFTGLFLTDYCKALPNAFSNDNDFHIIMINSNLRALGGLHSSTPSVFFQKNRVSISLENKYPVVIKHRELASSQPLKSLSLVQKYNLFFDLPANLRKK